MVKQENISLEENGMLTPTAMLAYLHGELNAAQTTKVQTILAKDPFAEEALEGLKSQIATTTHLNASIATINQKVKEKSGFKEKKNLALNFQWINYAFAASVIGILIGLAIWMINSIAIPKKEMTENIATDASTIAMISPTINGNIVLDTTTIASIVIDSGNPIAAMIATNETKTTNPQAIVSEKTATDDITTIYSPTTGYDQIAAADANYGKLNEESSNLESVKKAPTVVTAAGATTVASTLKNEAIADLEFKDKKAATNSVQIANDAYAKGDYRQAENEYKNILKEQPTNADALFYGGVSGYINGNYSEAEKNFDHLLKKGNYKDGAKWYKANILIKKGDNTKAKSLLKDLSKNNGYYTDRANQLLEEIK